LIRQSTGRLRAFCCLVSTVIAAFAGAQSYQLPGGAAAYDDPYIAAGFRALFTCSAHFLMQRPLEDILRVELADTRMLELPPPQIDTARRLVHAEDGRGATVIAAFRDTMGCTVLPPGSTENEIPRLPYAARDLPAHDPQLPFPQGDRVDIAEDPRLQALLDEAFAGGEDGDYGAGTLTTAVIIVHEGRIVAERYRPGFGIHQGYRTWSTAKSLSASLIGIAVAKGLLSLDEPAPIPEWQGPGDLRKAIQLNHLLWMSSGLWSEGSNTYAMYFGGQDVLSAVTTTPLEADPGSRWKYANNDTLLALRALRHAVNDDLTYLRFPYDELFHRIGMFHTWMETDHLGDFIGSSQVYTTARDLARFGLLYLNDGVWDGARILPEGWSDFVSSPAPSLPPEAGKQGYGAQFWLYDQLPGIPAGTYTTAGNKGQLATIVPATDLVVVRTGVDPLGRRWQQPAFVADVIAALK
jgi:CubicO group peptidase (beta-lactamase class C family)